MIRYRICTVGKDGHFTGPPQEVECADDREVVAVAMQMKNGLDMEIWDHKRFVIRLTVSAARGTGRRASTKRGARRSPPHRGTAPYVGMASGASLRAETRPPEQRMTTRPGLASA